ncbi:TetR/AcrR family transcriptional regulator [Kineococcus rubinsiae]|uniref:TetR/AcrR family transcriptional regulator n=1 Tax=Kineococcus rubinsiae TaxID=2609562 RepID=UPI0014306958|nr:TetR/AcrR family transcriptional regulator [Kineococcus rubinsiae]NIZ91859.1 TetR/AcrR family transcriptional regulator [Kineococcus rubinsiae]
MAGAPHRRDDARSTIVEVAAHLLAERGPAALTTRGVAEAAGVQAPTLYRLFGDKDGLLDAVAEHVMATFVSGKAAAVQAATVGEVDALDDLRAGWDAQLEFGVANPTIFRLLSDPERGSRSPAAEAGRRVLQARVHRIAEAGRLRVSERRAVDVVQSAGTGTIQVLLSTPVAERDPGLGDSVYEAVLRQIVTDVPAAAGDGPAAPAIALRALAPELDVLSAAERALFVEWLDRVVDAAEAPAPSPGRHPRPSGR